MGVLSATSIGILLSQSPSAYNALRILGAAYMVWLGIKNFRVKVVDLDTVIKSREEEHRPLVSNNPNAIHPFPFFHGRHYAADDEPSAHNVLPLTLSPVY